MEKTDKQLVEACKNNQDLKAFELLIKRHQHKVRSVVFKFLNNPDDLNDISQEVFIKAFKSIKSYRGEASFSTWLCRIAINTCKDNLKTKKVHAEKVVNINENTMKEIPEKYYNSLDRHISISEDQKMVFKEIKKLPFNQQLALVLHDIEDMTYEEIANLSECPIGTVKSRIFKARKTLKDKLKPLITSIQLT